MNSLQKARELLKTHFHFNQFRPGQEQAIQSILNNQDTFLVMPTGGGKSLCYQLPSLIFPNPTLVISPLISLMKDQVDKLQSLGIKASFINSSLTDFEVKERIRAMQKSKFDLVYIAPERFYSEEFNRKLFDLDIAMVAIDEAHCVSTWGHDFRPSYLKIKQIIKKFKKRPIVSAFTATATPFVRKDVVQELEMQNAKILVTGFDRPNLSYQTFNTYNDWQKIENIVGYLKSKNGIPGIIYAGTRKNVENISKKLNQWRIPNLPYHAGMDDEARKIHQEKFMDEKVPVVIATNAFGMGIDKKNLRFVIHYNMPGSLEAYYQEAGRAGRDGNTADCLLFYNASDRRLQEFFIESSHPSQAVIETVYEFLDNLNQQEILMTYEEINSKISCSSGVFGVGASLKILESHGFLTRLAGKEHSAFIKLSVPKEMIFNLVSSRAAIQRYFLESLLNLFPNKLFKGAEIELSHLAKTANLSGEQITRVLRILSDKGILEYTPPFRGYGLKMVKKNIPKEKLGIDYEKIEKNLQHDLQKLTIMENYVFSEDCKRKYILDYFGDEKKIEKCNNCDACGVQKFTEKAKDFSSAFQEDSEEEVIHF